MALAKKRSNSTRFVVIGVIIVAVVGVGFLLYQQLFSATNTNARGSSTSGTKAVITNFGESILNDSRYTSLKSYTVTTNADANRDGGQTNPFH